MLGHLQVILATPSGEQSEAIIHEGSTVDWSLLESDVLLYTHRCGLFTNAAIRLIIKMIKCNLINLGGQSSMTVVLQTIKLLDV